MTTRVANRDARKYVENLEFFKGSHTYGVWKHMTYCSLYVVYSYGKHHPLFVYDTDIKTWFFNTTKVSRTTTKHYSQLCPRIDQDANRMDIELDEILELVRCGGFKNQVIKRLSKGRLVA
jgi:hypothetical protein